MNSEKRKLLRLGAGAVALGGVVALVRQGETHDEGLLVLCREFWTIDGTLWGVMERAHRAYETAGIEAYREILWRDYEPAVAQKSTLAAQIVHLPAHTTAGLTAKLEVVMREGGFDGSVTCRLPDGATAPCHYGYEPIAKLGLEGALADLARWRASA